VNCVGLSPRVSPSSEVGLSFSQQQEIVPPLPPMTYSSLLARGQRLPVGNGKSLIAENQRNNMLRNESLSH